MADLTALQTELTARGFDRLDASGNVRKNYYLNRGYNYICDAEDWPFLLATTTGTSSTIGTISDLRSVESVIDTTSQSRLWPLDTRLILDEDYTLTTAGTPSYYYLTSTGIAVYPANTTDSFSVRYFKVPAVLSTGTDTPVIPARWHTLIVDAAAVYAYTDRNNFEAANAMRQVRDEGLQQMRESLLSQSHESVDDYVRITAGSEDF